MQFSRKLLKTHYFLLKLKLIEKKNHNVSFGWTLKLCILFMVITWKSALACGGGGGGGGGWGGGQSNDETTDAAPVSGDSGGVVALKEDEVPPVNEKQYINLTGITDPMERTIKTAWGGWRPDPDVQKEWKNWYSEYNACKALNEGTAKKNDREEQGPLECEKYGFPPGTGTQGADWGPGVSGVDEYGDAGKAQSEYGDAGKAQSEFSDDDRGPGSNWPQLPGWKGKFIVNLTDDTVGTAVERSAAALRVVKKEIYLF